MAFRAPSPTPAGTSGRLRQLEIRVLLACFLAAWLAAAPAAAREGFRVETRGGQLLEGTKLSLDEDQLTIWGDRSERQLPLSELLLVTALPPEPEPARPGAPRAQDLRPESRGDLLILAEADGLTGDRLWGQVVGGSPYGIEFNVEGAAPFEVPFERIARLLPRVSRPVDKLVLLEGAGLDDRVWRLLPGGELDGVSGVVDRVDSTGVVLESSLGPIRFGFDEILGVVFGATEPAEGAVDGAPVTLRLAGGTRLRGGLLDIGSGRIELATRFVDRLVLPLDALSSLVHRAPGVIPLADLDPVAVEEWPAIGEPEDMLFPWRRDLSVSGGVLALAGVPRATGFGVHANSRLTFALPAGSRSLRVSVGLVDEVLALPAVGTVRFEVRLDGEVVASTGVMTEGDQPTVLRVDGLVDGSRLELLVDDAGDYDAGDRAAWVDGLLLLGGESP